MFKHWKLLPAFWVAASTLAGEPTLTCEPQTLRGVPGEPLRLTLTVETDRVKPVQIKIPAIRHLALRTVEKIPIRRTPNGRYVQQRLIIWQGLEAGHITLTNLAAQLDADPHWFPPVRITVDPVPLAPPPAKEPAP